MPKVNISISQEVLQNLDKAAHESRTSRSAFLTRAVRYYLEERNAAQQREKCEQAAVAIDRFREEFGGWDGTAEILKWRDSH